ncbi:MULTISPECIES: hypothetical protein [unclassified Lysobacter]|uniref:hypothetical protein n=1 Tax=unclassified Lysobacter TaxID=2635362 RepID=UPI001BE59083|nr:MULTISPECIES: hypothetical protein [unclassified Lysobacter]MBT2750228.1 hypothetical protein [Lysobacter sp. ISL-50]MBT2775201.1 hypothetical protein [Lysobacter sp. ISL-54]MBT2782574.1 hypothetical protein [Lysobacter sp. ISL-52]
MKQIDPNVLTGIAGGADVVVADDGGMQAQRGPHIDFPPRPSPPPPWWVFVPEPLPWPFDRL